MLNRIRSFFIRFFQLATITTRIDDTNKGWTRLTARPNEMDYGEMVQLYRDALEATRKNPMAKTIVDITTDFVLGDGIDISSNIGRLQRFLHKFWNHPLNLIDQRLQSMSDELVRAGDLFVVLFRNPEDGMSYVRFVPKEQIIEIVTAENDWETELEFHQLDESHMDFNEPIVWKSKFHPEAAEADAIMIHYAINRPVGALYGEGDLDTVLPWLLKYSRMLEDRVRLHWSMRAFLWFVTVPSNKVEQKQAEYATPPESGSIIVKDDAEEWEVKTPTLRAADARHDLQAVRHMIDAVGYPPHWRGEPGDANLATATAMQLRPERKLRRRQNLMVYILEDLIYQSYVRAWQIGRQWGQPPKGAYDDIFTSNVADISRADNESLATAAHQLSQAFNQLLTTTPALQPSNRLQRLFVQLLLKFAGEPQDDQILDEIMSQAGSFKAPDPEQPATESIYKSNGHRSKVQT